jgi:hypothetical protein
MHDGQLKSGALLVSDGWRKTVLDWRMSISQGNFGAYPGFFPLPASANERKQMGIAPDEMAVKAFMGNGNTVAKRAGIKANAIITAVDGERRAMAGRAFLVWFNMHHNVGESVTITVSEAPGKSQKITYQLTARGE